MEREVNINVSKAINDLCTTRQSVLRLYMDFIYSSQPRKFPDLYIQESIIIPVFQMRKQRPGEVR